MNIKKIVACITCHEKVEIKPFVYGNGYVAICPKCGGLAYSDKEAEEETATKAVQQ